MWKLLKRFSFCLFFNNYFVWICLCKFQGVKGAVSDFQDSLLLVFWLHLLGLEPASSGMGDGRAKHGAQTRPKPPECLLLTRLKVSGSDVYRLQTVLCGAVALFLFSIYRAWAEPKNVYYFWHTEPTASKLQGKKVYWIKIAYCPFKSFDANSVLRVLGNREILFLCFEVFKTWSPHWSPSWFPLTMFLANFCS